MSLLQSLPTLRLGAPVPTSRSRSRHRGSRTGFLWHRGPSRAPAFHGTRHPPGKCTQPGRCSNFSCFSPTLENNSIFLNICTEEKVDFHCLCRVKMLLYLKEVGKNWHTTSHNTLTQLKVLCPPAAVSALTLHNQKERENCQIMLSRLDIFSN